MASHDEDGAEYLPDAEIVPGSEDAMAADFAASYRHLFRYTPGMGWMRCMPHVWVRDEMMTNYDLARSVARRLAGDEDKLQQRRAMTSSKAINAILSIARSDPLLTLEVNEWDAKPHELNTPGGVVDLRSGKVSMPGAESYFTRCTVVAPDFKAACPTWLRFLDEVFMGDKDLVEFMRRFIGYGYTGERREQKLLFLQGVGGNGKSVLVDAISAIAGGYMRKLPAHVLMHSQVQGHPTELAQLRGARLVISSEIEEGQYWAESRIKELTGDETLTARFMRQDFFEFRQQQKHIVVGNFKPRLKGGDAALARRFLLVPFRARFDGVKRDMRMAEKLRAEAPAILAWVIGGAVRWYAEGLAVPAVVADASSEYMQENDDLQSWIDESCVLHESARGRATPLYGNYLAWLKARGQHAPAMKTWADRLSVVPGVKKRKSNGTMVYDGIGLRTEDAQS